MHKHTLSGILLIGTMAIAALPASAGVVLYTDQQSYLAALGSVLTTNQVSLASVSGSSYPNFTANGLTFTGNPAATNSNIYGGNGSSPLFNNENFLIGNGLIAIGADSLSGIYGLSFNLGAAGNAGLYPLVISATNGGSPVTLFDTTTDPRYQGTPNYGNYPWSTTSVQFFGIVSTTPMTQITITSNNVVPNISIGNISTATSETPEAATLILIGAGLAVIARYRRYASSPVMA